MCLETRSTNEHTLAYFIFSVIRNLSFLEFAVYQLVLYRSCRAVNNTLAFVRNLEIDRWRAKLA